MEIYSDKLHHQMIMYLTCIRGSSAQKSGHHQRQYFNRNIRKLEDPEFKQPRHQ